MAGLFRVGWISSRTAAPRLEAYVMDILRHIDAHKENTDQCGCTAESIAERLNERCATHDGVVLFNEKLVGVVTEEELVGFVIVKVTAVDHESGEGGKKKRPDDKHDMKKAHCDSPSGGFWVRGTGGFANEDPRG